MNTTTGSTNLPADLSKMIGAEVCQVRAGNISPSVLNGIQFRRVWRQKLNVQPILLCEQISPHFPALVSRQRIPNQNQSSFPQRTLQAFEIRNDILSPDSPIAEPKKEFYTPSRWCCHQRADSRKTFPTESIANDRCLAARSPCAPDGRTFGKSAFIQKSDERIQAAGFFLNRGQSDRTHFRITRSLRSRALVSGRWQLQPIRLRTRHICRG